MIVVKAGGGEGVDYDALCRDLATQERFVLVHGGSALLNEISTQLGHPPRFVTSVSGHQSRYTDRRTLELFNMVYAGQMNKMLVEKLQALGVNALGLSGLDGRLVEGRRKRALKVVENGRVKVLRGDHSGTIQRVNVALLRLLLEHGYTPVLTPPILGTEGVALNVDADRFAGQIAVALRAEVLLLLSNVPGLLRRLQDPASLIREVPAAQMDALIEEVAQGRMKKKLLAAREALAGGVGRVVIGAAQGSAPVTRALQGAGTVCHP